MAPSPPPPSDQIPVDQAMAELRKTNPRIERIFKKLDYARKNIFTKNNIHYTQSIRLINEEIRKTPSEPLLYLLKGYMLWLNEEPKKANHAWQNVWQLNHDRYPHLQLHDPNGLRQAFGVGENERMFSLPQPRPQPPPRRRQQGNFRGPRQQRRPAP